MPEIKIRLAREEDLELLIELEHTYTSSNVWQMDIKQDENIIGVNFRDVRLPRVVQFNYPRSPKDLYASWQQSPIVFVGSIDSYPVSYIYLDEDATTGLVRVRDVVVSLEKRRQGIASGLILASEEWACRRERIYMILEMQSKNNPAINLAKKLGYQFCGFQDQYYPNHDLALFFGKSIR